MPRTLVGESSERPSRASQPGWMALEAGGDGGVQAAREDRRAARSSRRAARADRCTGDQARPGRGPRGRARARAGGARRRPQPACSAGEADRRAGLTRRSRRHGAELSTRLDGLDNGSTRPPRALERVGGVLETLAGGSGADRRGRDVAAGRPHESRDRRPRAQLEEIAGAGSATDALVERLDTVEARGRDAVA